MADPTKAELACGAVREKMIMQLSLMDGLKDVPMKVALDIASWSARYAKIEVAKITGDPVD